MYQAASVFVRFRLVARRGRIIFAVVVVESSTAIEVAGVEYEHISGLWDKRLM